MTLHQQGSLLRPATPNDAADLAWFINTAGAGMALEHWKALAKPGEDPWEIGRLRMMVGSGHNSWRNWTLAIRNAEAAGGLVCYALEGEPQAITPETPARFVPMIELENLAHGTWHVHVLATCTRYRRAGVGSELLVHAARTANGRRLSVIVDSRNAPAIGCYRKAGYAEAARRPQRDQSGTGLDADWVLMMTPA